MTANEARTLWMGDLEPYMDTFFILHAFDAMGEPALQVKMIINKNTGLPAGYCFVDFTDAESALRAQLRLNGKVIPNSQPPTRFKLNSNQIKDQQKKEFSLFVGDLSEEVDDFILFKAFSKKYPSCTAAKVVLDSRGHTKGYGFVRFSDEKDQQQALFEMQHSTGIGRRPIRVSLATPKKQLETPSSSRGPTHPHPPEYERYYQAYYQQYYANLYASQHAQAVPKATPVSYTAPDNGPSALEDPELEVNVDKYNREYMAQSEEIFEVLEDSRWHPMDQWNSALPTSAR